MWFITNDPISSLVPTRQEFLLNVACIAMEFSLRILIKSVPRSFNQPSRFKTVKRTVRIFCERCGPPHISLFEWLFHYRLRWLKSTFGNNLQLLLIDLYSFPIHYRNNWVSKVVHIVRFVGSTRSFYGISYCTLYANLTADLLPQRGETEVVGAYFLVKMTTIITTLL